MSFAFSAALFDDNNDSDFINNKRKHSKTQKNYKEGFDKGKVNSVLEEVHKKQRPDDDDIENEPRNFNPPPAAESMYAQKAATKETMMTMTNQNDIMFRTLGSAPQPTNQENSDLDLNNYSNYGDKKTVEEYYKKMLPGYNPNTPNTPNANPLNKLYHRMNNDQASNVAPTQDVLLQKINYMISLLEDQQDEKTNNVTEEVVLYSFLGIFIIFIVDSFAKVGKYVR